MKSKNSNKKIKMNVFHYTDYRKLLQDYYKALKKSAPHLASYRYLSQQAGFSSSNFVFLVIKGKRNIGYESIIKLAKILKFNKKEAKFFEHLVFFNQSETIEEKNFHLNHIESFKEFQKIKRMKSDQSDFYKNWYYPVIREIINLKDFQENPLWISKKIKPQIEVSQSRKAMNFLQELNFIHRDQSGKLQQTNQSIRSSGKISQHYLKNFHVNMLELAKKSLNESADKRQIQGVTMSVSEKLYQEIIEKMKEFQLEIQSMVAQDKEDPQKVCQLGLQLFELTKSK